MKVQQRSSGGCWRTLQGLADFTVVQSYPSTAAHWGITRSRPCTASTTAKDPDPHHPHPASGRSLINKYLNRYLEAAGYRKRIDLDAEIFRASEARTALIDGVVAAVARPAGGGASGTQDGESS